MTREHDECIKRGKIKPFSRGITLAPKELETAKADLETARKTYKEVDYTYVAAYCLPKKREVARGGGVVPVEQVA